MYAYINIYFDIFQNDGACDLSTVNYLLLYKVGLDKPDASVYIYMYICICIYIHAYKCVYIYIYMFIYMYIYIYIYIYIYMYLYMNIYIYMCPPPLSPHPQAPLSAPPMRLPVNRERTANPAYNCRLA